MADATRGFACEPCRASKVGCDKSRPQCMRCLRKGFDCHYAPKTRSHAQNSKRLVSESVSGRRTLNNSQLSRLRSQSPSSGIGSLSTTKSSQKRNRVPKACLRCRQLKVKCDRQQPCSRCLKVNGARECHYPAPSIVSDNPDESKDSMPLWKQRFHSGIHWSRLVENIESLLKHRRWAGSHGQHVNQDKIFSSTDNIFGTIGPLSNAPRRTLLSYIPPRSVAHSFIENYLDIIEPSHQILQVRSFKEVVGNFWDKPSIVDNGWLAQFFAILALGCQLHNTPVPTTRNNAAGISPARLFEAAQACLQRTPFMIRPTVTSIRTLCLFVIFKQTRSMTCLECDALWPATGLIVRLAVLLGLHSTDSTSDQDTQSGPNAVNNRNRLWAAVILLDLRQSLAAGMPVIPPSRDLIAEPLFNIEQRLPGAEDQDRKGLVFPLILYDILPQIFKILELATSPQVTLAYSLVATYDRQIRGLLKYYHTSFLSDNNNSISNIHRFQWIVTNVFFRRVLLALHSRLYQEPEAPTRYPVSYWSSLECSIALLSEQRELWDTLSSSSSSSPPSSSSSSSSSSRDRNDSAAATFFAHLFQQEFFLAAVTVCFHLVQNRSPLVEPNSYECQGHARRTILELLSSCRDIWGCQRGASVCHGRSFGMIDSLLGILEGEEGGGGEFCCVASGRIGCICHGQRGGGLFGTDLWDEWSIVTG